MKLVFSGNDGQVTIGEYDFHDKSKTGEVQRFHATEVLFIIFKYIKYTNKTNTQIQIQIQNIKGPTVTCSRGASLKKNK